MLQVKHVTITHKKDLRYLVKDMSFTLNPGDKAAIIGEEGNGKSTILKLIYQEELVEDYAEYTGEVIRNQERLGYLAQELSPEEKEKSVYEFLTAEPAFYDMDTGELARLAQQLKLPFELLYEQQTMGTLSGGEKIKVQLVRLLCTHPTIFLLDVNWSMVLGCVSCA